MELRELFEVKRVIVPGRQYGWVSTDVNLQAPEDGILAVAHNDTQQVNNNEGEWDVRVSIPVTAINSRVGLPSPQGRGAELQFSLPWGINGSAQINLPPWIQSPRPRFSFHKTPTHGFDPQQGVFCTEVELPIPLWKARVCVHVTLS